MMYHEPWRDEAQAWLLARDNPDIFKLLSYTGYEGTPALWHLLLYILARLNLPYSSMFILHFFIIFAAVVVFVKHAPFNWFQKTLFVFGYYMIFEYNIVARNYALSVLFLFLLASYYHQRFNRPVPYSSLLFLLANTNVHSLIISIFISSFYFIELWANKRNQINILAISIIILGLSFAILQLLPPPDLASSLKAWGSNIYLSVIAPYALNNAFFPVPDLEAGAHDKLLLFKFPYILVLVAIIALTLSILALIQKPQYLLFYLFVLIALSILFSFKYVGYPRHSGFIFLSFIFSLWVSKKTKSTPHPLFNEAFQSKVFTLFLIVHFISAMIIVYHEINYDFSASKKAFEFLKTNNLLANDTFILTYQSTVASSILPFIDESHQFYYLEYEEPHSFLIWNQKYQNSKILNETELLYRISRAIKLNNYSNYIILLNIQPKTEDFNKNFQILTYFNGTIASDESMYLYSLKKNSIPEGVLE